MGKPSQPQDSRPGLQATSRRVTNRAAPELCFKEDLLVEMAGDGGRELLIYCVGGGGGVEVRRDPLFSEPAQGKGSHQPMC